MQPVARARPAKHSSFRPGLVVTEARFNGVVQPALDIAAMRHDLERPGYWLTHGSSLETCITRSLCGSSEALALLLLLRPRV